MSQELASGYVTVIPTTKGLSKGIENEISGGVDGGTKRADKSFLASTGKWVATAGIAGGALVAAFAIKGGIERLLSIDEAEGKLRGLGYSSEEISGIMNSALGSVKGTAFGLGDAATAAAGALAAGIQPGQQLQKYLTLVGDAATIAGADFNEMGLIFNKVAAKGKVGMEEINQLSERGIPIMQWLAKEYGVSAAELAKMVSKGQIDAKAFRKAIEKNIGGAAQASGQTFKGSLANLGASASRIIANLFGPVFKTLPGLFQQLTSALEPLEGVAKAVGAVLGWVFGLIVTGITKVVGFIATFKEEILAVVAVFAIWKGISLSIALVTGAIAALRNAFMVARIAVWLFNASLLANPIFLIVAAVAALVAGIVWAYKNFEGFRNVVDAVFGFIKQVVGAVVNWFTDTAMPYLKQGWDFAVRTFQAAWDAIQPILNIIKTVVTFIFNAIKSYFTVVFNIYKTIFLAAWNILKTVVTTVVNAIRPVITFVFNAIKTYFTVMFTVYKTIFVAAWNVIKTIITTVVNVIKTVITTTFNVVKTVIQAVMKVVSGVIRAQVAVWSAIFNGVRAVITRVIGFFSNLARAVAEKIRAVTQKIGEIKGKITGAFSGAVKWLVDAGKNVVQGLVNGLQAAKDWVIAKIREIADLIPDWIKDRLGISSPSKVTMALGRFVGEGLAEGIRGESKNVQGAVDDLSTVASALEPATFAAGLPNAKAHIAHTVAALASASAAQSRQPMVLMLQDRDGNLQGWMEVVAAGTVDQFASILAGRQAV